MLLVEYKRRACQPRSQMLFAFTCLIIVCMLPRLYGLLYAGKGWSDQVRKVHIFVTEQFSAFT